MTRESELKQKILDQISDKKPLPKNYFIFLELIVYGLITILVVLAALTVCFYLWDLEEILSISKIKSLYLLDILTNSLVEILVFSLVLGLAGYLIYRQTDLPGVKHRFGLVVSLFGLIGIMSVVFYVATPLASTPFSEMLDNTKYQYDKWWPHRRSKLNIVRQELQRGDWVIGRVKQVKPSGGEKTLVVLHTQQGNINVFVPESQASDVKLGMVLVVQMDDKVSFQPFINSRLEAEYVVSVHFGNRSSYVDRLSYVIGRS
jgi:hypothetical protein